MSLKASTAMTIIQPMTGTRWNSDSAPENPARVQMRQVGMIRNSATTRCAIASTSRASEPRPRIQAMT